MRTRTAAVVAAAAAAVLADPEATMADLVVEAADLVVAEAPVILVEVVETTAGPEIRETTVMIPVLVMTPKIAHR